MALTILNGGTRTSQNVFVGVNFELTVDSSNKELRLHDGSTPGGVRIPNIDTTDARYQARSAELDGFNGFQPNAHGFLFRVGSAHYELRQFVGPGGIDIANADGINGNPSFTLSEQIPGDHQFNGDMIVTGVLQVDGGVNSDTSGKHVGASEGTHTGPTVGLHTGGIDVRGKTVQFDDGQIPASAVSGLSALRLPLGMIMMWAGTIATIPQGWALCDGNNGTPDLAGNFVVAAAVEADMHLVGGSVNHTHVATAAQAGEHTHGVTVEGTVLTIAQMPTHGHKNGICDNGTGNALFPYGNTASPVVTPDSVANVDQGGTQQGFTENVGGSQPHIHLASSTPGGNHTHGLTVEAQVHLPPFYTIAYIMKIA